MRTYDHDYEPMTAKGSFWICCACEAENHETDGDCQWCECEGAECKRDNCDGPCVELKEGKA